MHRTIVSAIAGAVLTCPPLFAQTAASGPEAIMPTLSKEVPGARIGWRYDAVPTFAAAQKDGKPIVIVFEDLSANWSRLFVVHVLRCPTFNTLAGQAHFLIVAPYLVTDDATELAKKFGIHDLPALSIISIKGQSINEIFRLTGASDEAQVLQIVRQAGLSPGPPGQANAAPALGTIAPAGCLPTRHPDLRELRDASVTLPPQSSN
jgi:hypothetical protein